MWVGWGGVESPSEIVWTSPSDTDSVSHEEEGGAFSVKEEEKGREGSTGQTQDKFFQWFLALKEIFY